MNVTLKYNQRSTGKYTLIVIYTQNELETI